MLLALPLLSRLYEPQAFGELGVYVALTMVLSVGACLRFEIATPVPDEDSIAFGLVVVGIASATLISLALLGASLLLPNYIFDFDRFPSAGRFEWLVPLGVWLTATYSALQFWSIRMKRFSSVAKTQFTRSVGGTALQVLLGAAGSFPFGLPIGHLLYMGIGSVGLAKLLWSQDRNLIPKVSISSLKRTIILYKKYPLYSVPESLLNAATVNIPLVIVATYVGKAEAGHLLLAQKICSVPIGLVGASISRVFLANSREEMRNANLEVFTRKLMFTLFATSLIPFVLLAAIAPAVFPYVFGSEWLRAGEMVAWIVPFVALQFIVSPVSTYLHSTGRQSVAFYLQAYGFVVVIGAITFAIHFFPEHVFESFAIASFVYYLTYAVIVLGLTTKMRITEE